MQLRTLPHLISSTRSMFMSNALLLSKSERLRTNVYLNYAYTSGPQGLPTGAAETKKDSRKMKPFGNANVSFSGKCSSFTGEMRLWRVSHCPPLITKSAHSLYLPGSWRRWSNRNSDGPNYSSLARGLACVLPSNAKGLPAR